MGRFFEEFIKREQVTGMIFDVDGTLLDSMSLWDHSGENYLRSLGIQPSADLAQTLFTMTMQQGAVYMKETYQMQETTDEIKAGVYRMVADRYQKEVPMKPSALAFLQALQAAGIPMAVATSTERPLILGAFERLGLVPYFTQIFTCPEFGSGKSEPGIFHAASEVLHSEPSTTWVVEDGLYAIRTAKAAGYKIIGIADASSEEDEPQIRALADYFITDFAMDMEIDGTNGIEKRTLS